MRASISSSVAALLAALALVAAGCSLPADSAPQAVAAATTEAPAQPPVASESPAPPTAVPVDPLDASFAELTASLPLGAVGIAVHGGPHGRSFGSWSGGAAWSTIKVALAVAALRPDGQGVEPLVTQAITQSDNAAAEELWTTLGPPTQAAQLVQAVLADGGDTATVVQSQQVRPPYSSFGQTMWSQQQQARFAFGLPCVESAEPVIDKMRQLDTGQRWGLAASGDVAAKGGWGPDPDGGYLVRQLALIGNGPGTSGVALAVKPADGTFETGTAMLTRLGQWVLEHREELPAGQC